MARVLVVGDSTACTMLPGLEAVGARVGVRIENAAVIGCGVVSGTLAPDIVNGRNIVSATRHCQSRANASEARALQSGRPNVVVWASTWERDSFVEGSGRHQRVLVAGSRAWSTALMARIRQRVRTFTAEGATVVFLTQAPFVEFGNPTGPTSQDRSFERLNTFLAKFVAHDPHVRLVDLASLICPSGPPCPLSPDNVDGVRADGAHYSADGSLFVARWLMPRLGIKALDHPVATLPTINIVLPKRGATLKGSAPLSALTSFNLGVSTVQFFVTGGTVHNLNIGSATFGRVGWLLFWNTAAVPNGTYTIRSVAYSASGSSTSKSITVEVAN